MLGFTLIGWNKLQMDVPKHWASYSDYMEFLNLIDQTNTFGNLCWSDSVETDKYSYLRSLTKWHFNNMNLTDFLVNSIMNTGKILSNSVQTKWSRLEMSKCKLKA